MSKICSASHREKGKLTELYYQTDWDYYVYVSHSHVNSFNQLINLVHHLGRNTHLFLQLFAFDTNISLMESLVLNSSHPICCPQMYLFFKAIIN